jgi:hypothetical protein
MGGLGRCLLVKEPNSEVCNRVDCPGSLRFWCSLLLWKEVSSVLYSIEFKERAGMTFIPAWCSSID